MFLPMLGKIHVDSKFITQQTIIFLVILLAKFPKHFIFPISIFKQHV